MKFCSECGAKVVLQVPAGDDRPRHVCESCEFIHYQNPRVIVGCLPIAGDKILLCKRAIEPRLGCWTIPAGFMENGETMLQGALRETREEADAKVKDAVLYRLFDIPRLNQIYVFYRGELDGEFGVGPESLDSRLFSEDEIPWSELAFPTITDVLLEYFGDRKTADYPVRDSQPGPKWAEDVGFHRNDKL